MVDSEQLPRDPADLRLLVHALVDGELDAATALALERRMADDPALAAEHGRVAALKARIGGLPRPEASAGFAARMGAIGARPTPPAPRRRFRLSAFEWGAIAASLMVGVVLSSGVTRWAMLRPQAESFAIAVANDHRRSLLAASPVDVASSDRHTVKPWLDAKLGFSPPAPDLAAHGFPLLGGRIEVVGNEPVPALVYRHNEHLLTLVAVPRSAPAPAGGGLSTLGAAGLSIVRWGEGGFTYWAISDAETSVIEEFANRFRAAAAGG